MHKLTPRYRGIINSRLTVGRYIKQIKLGRSITGVSLTYQKSELSEHEKLTVNHVRDAFTFRQYLVKVFFAQCSFVVSIKNTEAANAEEAVKTATQRAALAHLEAGVSLGNLMDSAVCEDTPENRKILGVEGSGIVEPWRGRAAA